MQATSIPSSPIEPQEVVYGGDNGTPAVLPSPTKTVATAMSLHDDDHHDDDNDNDDSDDAPPSFCQRIGNYVFSHNGKELLACCLAGGLFFGLGYLVDEPQQRPIPSQHLQDSNTYILNLSLNNSFDGDSVPSWSVALLAIILGPGLQMIVSYFVGAPSDMHRTLCVNILALTFNDLSTWLLKAYAGYFRPSFYQLCQPDETYEYCTNNEGYTRDSFPSGHASFAFLSMTILSLYLERCFGVSSVERAFVIMAPATTTNDVTKQPVGLEYSRPPVIYRFASMLCALPLAVATFVAVSRVVDNRHHPADIIAGGILGSFLGYFFHTSWYVASSKVASGYSMPPMCVFELCQATDLTQTTLCHLFFDAIGFKIPDSQLWARSSGNKARTEIPRANLE